MVYVKNASWPFFDSGVGAERAVVAGSKNGLLLRVAKATCVHWQGLSPVRVIASMSGETRFRAFRGKTIDVKKKIKVKSFYKRKFGIEEDKK